MNAFLLSFFIFLVYQQVGHCLNCHQCTACGGSSTWTTTSSSTNGAACFKYVYNSGNIEYVNRGVLSSCVAGTVSGATTYCCSTDYCNGSHTLQNSFLFIFSLLIMGNRLIKTISN